MPARTSSPISAPLEPLAHAAVVLSPREVVDLRRFLDLVPDPRGLRGRRYPAVALLTAAAAAVLADARSLAAIGEWIADGPQQVPAALGLRPDPLTAWNPVPHSSTTASLRNLAISTFRQDGDTNIAAALRRTGRDYRRPLDALA